MRFCKNVLKSVPWVPLNMYTALATTKLRASHTGDQKLIFS